MSAAKKIQVRYERADGSHISNADVQIVGRRLQMIERRYGRVTPEIIVRDATSKNSPLHRFFEWNDQKAAEQRRLDQARYLIRSVRIVIEEATETPVRTRAFVKIDGNRQRIDKQDDTSTAPGFRSVARVLSNDDMRREHLGRLVDEAVSFAKRLSAFKAFSSVVDEIHHVRDLWRQGSIET